MAIYLVSSLLAVVASVFIFADHVVIVSESACPLVLIGLAILQAVIFNSEYNESRDHTNETNYTTLELDYAAVRLSARYHALTRLAIIPLLGVCVFYFGGAAKIAVSVLIYVLSFIPVPLLVKYGGKSRD